MKVLFLLSPEVNGIVTGYFWTEPINPHVPIVQVVLLG